MAARKKKNTVDYFPHLIRGGKTMFIIESKYKNDGYATWFKILERLGTSENHFIDLSDNKELMYLASTCNIDEDLLKSIINDLVDLDKFDKDLWGQNIIWSQDFVDNISDLYKRRESEMPTKQLICEHLKLKSKHNTPNDDIGTHSIVKDSIVEESKVKDSKLKEKKKEKKKEEETELHSQFIEIYFNWFKKRFDLKPQFDGGDGKAIYSIINFLRKNLKEDRESGENDEVLLNSWKWLLDNDRSWDKNGKDYYRSHTRIRQIASNLTNILINLKHEKGNYTADGSKIDEQWIDELFKDTTIPQL